MLSIVLPCGKELYDGAVITLGNSPQVYVLHYGKYKSDSIKKEGWYIQSIGSTSAVELTDYITSIINILHTGAEITVDDTTYECGGHTGCSHCYGIGNNEFTDEEKYQLARTWITVDTIAERDALEIEDVTNGRVVQVNKCIDGNPHYFRHDGVEWKEVEFVHVDDTETLDSMKQEIESLHQEVETLTSSVEALQSSIGEYQNELEATTGKVEELQRTVQELQSKVQE